MKKKRDDFEDLSSFSSNSEYKKAKKAKKGKHTGLKVFLSIICVLLILAGGGIMYISNYLLGDLTTTTITKDREELGIASDVISNEKITNVALFGVDSRADDFTGRSDVIIIVSLDEIHGKVKMTSILRDSRVQMWDGYPNTSTGWDKINHAYMFGGPEAAIRVINQNYKLDIQDYVTVNFNKTAEIVDAFGGVDIEISGDEAWALNINLDNLDREDNKGKGDHNITDYDYVGSGGMVHLTGNAAVAFMRIRNIDSDNARAGRQQRVLEAVMEKAMDMNLEEYPAMIKNICALCETSLSISDITGYVPFVMDGFKIERNMIPGEYEASNSGTYENGAWMWDYDLDVAAQHLREIIYEEEAKEPENP